MTATAVHAVLALMVIFQAGLHTRHAGLAGQRCATLKHGRRNVREVIARRQIGEQIKAFMPGLCCR